MPERLGQIPKTIHTFLLLDGSGSMKEIEHSSGKPKHRAVAEAVQDLVSRLHAYSLSEGADIELTVTCYDSANVDDVRVSGYKVSDDRYVSYPDVDNWDPLRGHGSGTPIGRALEAAFERAKQWIARAGDSHESRRAKIMLLSDGMNYPDSELDGSSVKEEVRFFNENNKRHRISLYTIGYFQAQPGAEDEEASGRELLRNLTSDPTRNYCEAQDASTAADYILRSSVAAV
jgi:hypothetical protein